MMYRQLSLAAALLLGGCADRAQPAASGGHNALEPRARSEAPEPDDPAMEPRAALLPLSGALDLGAPVAVDARALDAARRVLTDPGDLPQLRVTVDGQKRALPLLHTEVRAEVSGFVARVEVTQTWRNPLPTPIEAVYVFPLPENSAVDAMRMRIGERLIEAQIQRREQARRIYEEAKARGHTAALLEQERPNVFTQSVANMEPGRDIEVTLRYVQDLTYDSGEYELVFPMVVGPRFIPGVDAGTGGDGWARDTDEVPDASRITPPIVGGGRRSGHDIGIEVIIDPGLPVVDLDVPTHQVDVEQRDGAMVVRLAAADTLPNRDFVLRFRADGPTPQGAVYAHRADRGGTFSLVVQPPAADVDTLLGLREVLLVVDVSGSMRGRPLGMAKDAAREVIRRLRPVDTFNVITFAGRTARAFDAARPANAANVREALGFVDRAAAGGGTLLANAVRDALSPAVSDGRDRIVVFLTDGYVGNEARILADIEAFVSGHDARSLLAIAVTQPTDRFWPPRARPTPGGTRSTSAGLAGPDPAQNRPVGPRAAIRQQAPRGHKAHAFGFGVGSSVNRHLLDGIGEAGRGASVYLTSREDPSRAVDALTRMVDRPILTDVHVDWGDLDVDDIQPEVLPDLIASRPLVLHGRYRTPGEGTVVVSGMAGGERVSVEVPVRLPEREAANGAVETLWARARIESLERALWSGPDAAVVEQITSLGLDYGLVTAYTSFVAVDRSATVGDGRPVKIEQPADCPEGVDLRAAAPPRAVVQSGGYGASGGVGRTETAGAGETRPGRMVDTIDPRKVGLHDLLSPNKPGGRGAIAEILLKNKAAGIQWGHEREQKTPRPVAHLDDVRVKGPAGVDVLKRKVKAKMAAIRAAYERRLHVDPTLEGKLVLAFTVGKDGRVVKVSAKKDTVGSADLRADIARVLAQIRLPPQPGKTRVTITLTLLLR